MLRSTIGVQRIGGFNTAHFVHREGPPPLGEIFELLTDFNTRKITLLAESIGVHTAIVAGRIRWENKNYNILSSLIGNKQVRNKFPSEFS